MEQRDKHMIEAAKKILPPGYIIVPAAPALYRRWPFVEKPGEFTARFAAAMGHIVSPDEASPGLAAMRQVLIENPPALSPDYLSEIKV